MIGRRAGRGTGQILTLAGVTAWRRRWRYTFVGRPSPFRSFRKRWRESAPLAPPVIERRCSPHVDNFELSELYRTVRTWPKTIPAITNPEKQAR